MSENTCSVSGCSAQVKYSTKRLCGKHYMASYRRPVSDQSCQEENCEKPSHARGWCRAHYEAWYNAQRRKPPLTPETCVVCDREFIPNKAGQKTCRPSEEERQRSSNPTKTQSWCARHLYHFNNGAARELKATPPPLRPESFDCAECGKQAYPGKNGTHAQATRFCSRNCKFRWHACNNDYVATPRTRVPWKDCEDCGTTFVGRGRVSRCKRCERQHTRSMTGPARRWTAGSCQECGDAFVSRWHPTWPCRFCGDTCYNRHARRKYREKHGRSHQHRKRARKYGGKYEPVSKLKVFKRDGYICQICGEPTSAKYTFDDPLSPTLDHIHPMSRGGDHTYLNVQCAHMICNSLKCDSVGEDAPQLNLAL